MNIFFYVFDIPLLYISPEKAGKPNDVIVLDYAYHGHTQALVDISPYKWFKQSYHIMLLFSFLFFSLLLMF